MNVGGLGLPIIFLVFPKKKNQYKYKSFSNHYIILRQHFSLLPDKVGKITANSFGSQKNIPQLISEKYLFNAF